MILIANACKIARNFTNHLIIVGIKLSTTLPDPRQLGARSQWERPEATPHQDNSDIQK